MKKYVTHLISTALLVMLCTSFSCKESTDNVIEEDKEDGNEVVKPPTVPFSKGVNLSDWFLANSEAEIYKNSYTKNELLNIKSLGVDVVRLPIRFYKVAEDSPDYLLNSSFFEKLDYALDLAEEVGLNIIIDNHSYFGSNPFPQAYGEDQLIKIWKQIAQHCKDRSNLIYYELYNEPDGSYMKNNWGEMQGRFIKAIREIDTKHTIIVGGYDANSAQTLKDLPEYDDDNLIYTFHFYTPFLFTAQGADWLILKHVSGVPFPYDSNTMPECPPELIGTGEWGDKLFDNYPTIGTIAHLKNVIDQAVSFSKERNVPIFCGEFGVYMHGVGNEKRCFWYKTVVDYFKEKGISWTMWDYHNSFGLYEKGKGYNFNSDLNVPLLKALDFTVPLSYSEGVIPDVTFYDDVLQQGMSDNSYNPDGITNFFYTENTFSGTDCIRFKAGGKWSSITVGIWPVMTLQKQVSANCHLKFALKSSISSKIRIRFAMYKDGEKPWSMSYDIKGEDIKSEWTEYSIPLADFVETGAVSGGTYFPPENKFSWDHINKFEIATDGNEDLINAEIFVDQIFITQNK